MAKKSPSSSPALEFYKKAASSAGIELKGATMPYTSLNGHMFSVFQKDNTLNLRLDAESMEDFKKKHKTDHPFQYGIKMTNYVVVPADVLAKTSLLKKYLLESHAYVKTLKAKATTRKK